MGPKKKKGGSSKAEEVPLIIDGESTAEMTKEQLEEYAKKLIEEKDNANRERNFFQLERDQVARFWQVTMQKLDDLKSKIRSMEMETELDEDGHQLEIKLYKQKVKNILYEHEDNIVRLRSMAAVAMQVAEEDFDRKVKALYWENRSLQVTLKEQELAETDLKKEIQRECEKNNTEIRVEYQRKLNEELSKCKADMERIRKELKLQRKTEIHEIEERKNTHIQRLMKNHERAFNEVKVYYNEITQNNLSLINNLKNEVEELKSREETLESHIHELTVENKKLSEPLRRAKGELEELRKQLSNYELDKLSLKRAKKKIKEQEKEMSRLNFEEEVQRQTRDQITSERDELIRSFEKALIEIQQKSNLKNLLLEKKLEKILEDMEVKEAQFNEILKASNLDERSMSILNRKIEEVLGTKNIAIKNLQYEVSRVAKSHNDLIKTYTAHLNNMGISIDNLGFVPLEPRNSKGRAIGKGVAGLVSKPHLSN